MKLGEILLQKGIISEELLIIALGRQKENPETRIGVVLVELDYVDVKTIVETLAKQKPMIKQDVPALAEQEGTFKGVPPDQGNVMVKLGETLLMEKVITEEQLQEALEYQEQYPGTMLGQALIDLGFATRKIISNALRKLR